MRVEGGLLRTDQLSVGMPGVEGETSLHPVLFDPVEVGCAIVIDETEAIPDAAARIVGRFGQVEVEFEGVEFRHDLPDRTGKELPVTEAMQQVPRGMPQGEPGRAGDLDAAIRGADRVIFPGEGFGSWSVRHPQPDGRTLGRGDDGKGREKIRSRVSESRFAAWAPVSPADSGSTMGKGRPPGRAGRRGSPRDRREEEETGCRRAGGRSSPEDEAECGAKASLCEGEGGTGMRRARACLRGNLALKWSLMRLAVFLLVASLPLSAAADHDLIVENARILDGTGATAFTGSVAVKDGRISAVGAVAGTADLRLDARGRVLAPGFIDVHTHSENLAKIPDAENFLRMGVTTIVTANCGNSRTDLAAFFEEIRTTGTTLNVASLIGHNAVRESGMGGRFIRPPKPVELEAMKSLVARRWRTARWASAPASSTFRQFREDG